MFPNSIWKTYKTTANRKTYLTTKLDQLKKLTFNTYVMLTNPL